MNKHINIATKIMTITPEMARKMLDGNTENRPLHGRHIDRIALAMSDGRWSLNGESIKFSSDGVLIDGQHRLMACIKSGVSFDTVIISNVDPASFSTIDIGTKRTAGDAIGRMGFKNHNAIASALRWVVALTDGKTHRGNVVLDPDQAMAILADNIGIQDSVSPADKVYPLVPKSIGVALHYLFAHKDRAAADKFFFDLKNGENLNVGDPVLSLRNRLVTGRLTSKVKLSVSSSETVALMIRAWNARRSGRQITISKGLVKNADGELVMPEIE